MTSIKLERIVPLEVPDAAVCEDGVCEIPSALTDPQDAEAAGRS